MHREILTKNQLELLPLISNFSKQYYMVGGTAIALHVGHRYSIDLDLFTESKIKRIQIKNILEKNGYKPQQVIYEAYDQMHLIVNGVKITFFQYPYKVTAKCNFDNVINIPELIDLAAMKAYALGGRAKWKDYVDMYFILKDYFSLRQVVDKAIEIFNIYFNEKLFREQLSYFNDVDYTESVTYLDKEVLDKDIKQFLIKAATTEF